MKKLAWCVGSTLIAAFLIVWFLELFGIGSPIVALWTNWIAMTWAVIVSQVVCFSLPARYYDIKAYERAGRIYERLGVRHFQRLLRRGPFSMLNRTIHLPRDKTISALRHLGDEMRKAETNHLVIFVLILAFTGYALLRGRFDAAGWLTLFNVMFNGYPVMLQRYNRIRLHRLRAHLKTA